MKATTHTTEIIAAPIADPGVISKLIDLISRFRETSAEKESHRKKGYEHYIFCEQFLSARSGAFKPGKSAKAQIEACKRPSGSGHDVIELQKAMEAMDAEYAEGDRLDQQASALETELREFLKQEGSAFDAQIITAHKTLVAEIAKRIRPECVSDDEASLVAQGLDRPTMLHSKLYSWRRGGDLLSSAQNFKYALQEEIPPASGK